MALAAYRSGDNEDALLWLEKSRRADSYRNNASLRALVLMLESMARHRTGSVDEARQARAQADPLIDEHLAKLAAGEMAGWHDWLIADILRQEADRSAGTGTTQTEAHEEMPHTTPKSE